jgi:hypothetical protein
MSTINNQTPALPMLLLQQSTASVAALRLRGGHAEWLVAQKSGMPGVYCLRVEVLEGLQGLTLEGYLGGCGYVMEEAQKVRRGLVWSGMWVNTRHG